MIQNLPEGIFMPESRTAIHVDDIDGERVDTCCDFDAVKLGIR